LSYDIVHLCNFCDFFVGVDALLTSVLLRAHQSSFFSSQDFGGEMVVSTIIIQSLFTSFKSDSKFFKLTLRKWLLLETVLIRLGR
jgi:hypothetical protein